MMWVATTEIPTIIFVMMLLLINGLVVLCLWIQVELVRERERRPIDAEQGTDRGTGGH